MKINIITVANRPPKWTEAAVNDYIKPCPWAIEVTRIPLLKDAKNQTAASRKEKEAEKIIKKLDDFNADFTFVLDEKGRSLDSVALSQTLDKCTLTASKIAFVIGGPDGTSQTIRKKANLTLSLSEFTLPHHLAKIVLIEQLYRASMILKGHPYHR